MENKLVCIIIPAYNASTTILETYKSIVEQTYSKWEWIVIDDFSSDNTFDIISSLAKDDSRIILIHPAEKGGAAVARNAGIEKHEENILLFLMLMICGFPQSWKNKYLLCKKIITHSHIPIMRFLVKESRRGIMFQKEIKPHTKIF